MYYSLLSGGSIIYVSGLDGSGFFVIIGYIYIGGFIISYLYRYGYLIFYCYGDIGCFYCVVGGVNRNLNERF